MCVVMASENLSYIHISLFYKNSNLNTYEIIYYVFRIIYVAMFNIQFSALDNVKMMIQIHKY